MNYWTFDGDNSARLIGDETENENSGCAKVKIIRSSIDNSDIFAYTRKKAVSIVPSSSAAGLISECPTGEFKSGQRVFLSCSGKSGSDGASGGYLRDYANVSTDYIYELPDVIADNDIVFIDSIAKACNLIDKLEIKPLFPKKLLLFYKLSLITQLIHHALV